MITGFITVAQQVLILFILIAVGVVCKKVKLFDDRGASALTDVVLYVVTPCVIIEAFQRKYEPQMLVNLGVAALSAAVMLGASILLSNLIFARQSEARKKVLVFAGVFSNCGFISLPLQKVLLGNDGVFYAAAFIAVFNIYMWTYGVITMSGKNNAKSMLKAVLNPGIIGTVIGIILFSFSITLPETIISPIRSLSVLNTPVPMLVIGYYLASANLKKAFCDVWAYIAMALRLVVVPVASIFILLLCSVRSTLMVSLVISSASSVAAFTTMMSAKYNRDTQLSVSLVSASTILSLVTMPLVISLAQHLA